MYYAKALNLVFIFARFLVVLLVKDFRNLSESGQVALVQLAVKVVSLCSLSELRRMDSRPKGLG